MKNIAVLGANGRLGNEVVHAFHAAGYQVTAVTRNGRIRRAPDGVQCRAADMLNLKQLKKAVAGADIIFNAVNPPYTEWLHAALPMARNIIQAARDSGATHLFPGNVYNYGRNIPALCTTDTPMEAAGVKGKVRIEMEKLFRIAADKYKVQTLILRAGDFYGGTGKGSWFDLALADKINKGQFVYPGPVDVTHAWAYLPDLARAFVAVAEKHDTLGSFENLLYPGHSLTGNEFKALLEQACGRELKILGMPWKLIKLGGILVPMWREIAEVAYLWERPHRLDGTRLREVVGELQQTAPEVAIREAYDAPELSWKYRQFLS
ncbi:MAG: NAD-dependent epimerase/dehydratase family protein [Thiolinea sp.]